MATQAGSTRTYVLTVKSTGEQKLIEAGNPSQVLRHAALGMFDVHVAGREEFKALYKKQLLAGVEEIESVKADDADAGTQVEAPQPGGEAPQEEAPVKSKKSKEGAAA
jgi:hypothetical protein